MLEPDEARLRIFEAMVGQATKVGLFDPTKLIESCTQVEKYVLGLSSVGEAPTPTPRKTLTRPVKDNQVPSFLSQ
jgi:hypothetical protein